MDDLVTRAAALGYILCKRCCGLYSDNHQCPVKDVVIQGSTVLEKGYQHPPSPGGTALRVESVNHPDHYGGESNIYECIKVIEAWDLGFNLGNTVKYISRAGKKNPDKVLEDLKKAVWYLQREIDNRSK